MSLRRSIAWSFAGQLTTFLVFFGGSVTLARILTPYEMGIFAFGFALSSIIAQVQNLGLPQYVISEHDVSREKNGTVFLVNAGISIVLSLVLLATALYLRYQGSSEVAHVLTLLAPIPLFSIVDIVPFAMLNRKMMFRELALVQVTRAIVGTTTAVTFAVMGFSYASMAWGSLAGGLASTLLMVVLGRMFLSMKPGITHLNDVLRFGLRILLIAGVDNLSIRFNDVLIGRMIGITALGFYSRAASLTTMVYDGLYMAIVRVFFPALADYDRISGDLREPYLRSCKVLTGIMWAASAGLAILASPAVILLFGEKWAASGPILTLLSLSQIPLLAFPLHWELFIIKGKTPQQMRLEPLYAVFSLGIFLAGAMISLEAAAASRILIGFVWIAIYARPVLDMTNLTLRDFLLAYRDSALLTLAAIFPALVVMQMNQWSPNIGWIAFLFAVLLGLVSWLAATVVLRHPIRNELESIVARARSGLLFTRPRAIGPATRQPPEDLLNG
jgi:O-antigen/teichoic acid export membrane protein